MIDELADLLLGARCPGCARPGLGLCSGCRAQLDGPATPVDDLPRLAGLPTVSAGRWAGPLPRLVSAHKDRGALALTPVLGRRLAAAVELLLVDEVPGASEVWLVPVPSTRQAVRRRGLDHSRAIARAACRHLRRPAGSPLPGARAAVLPVVRVAPVLRRTGRVADNAHLSARERARNQAGSMAARPPVGPGALAVVTDDVCTTGASIAEAARALSSAGWAVAGAAVVAHPTRSAKSLPAGPARRADQQ